jgi:HEAT repeat protein
LELLKDALADPDYGIRSAAARSLGDIAPSEDSDFGKKATPLLVPLLKDLSPRVRSATARALGLLGKPDDLPVLADGLNDNEGSVRCYAAGAILRILHKQSQRGEPHRNAFHQTRAALPIHPS